MKKKFMKTLLCSLMLFATVISPTHAAASEADTTEIRYEVADLTTLSGGLTRAPEILGALFRINSLSGNPKAFAYTQTGTEVYKIYASVSCTDEKSNTYTSTPAEQTNSSSVISGTIESQTSSCTFIGTHKVQETSSSGWLTCTTSTSY